MANMLDKWNVSSSAIVTSDNTNILSVAHSKYIIIQVIVYN